MHKIKSMKWLVVLVVVFYAGFIWLAAQRA